MKDMFPGLRRKGFDNKKFERLLERRNRLDYQCFMFLQENIDEMPNYLWKQVYDLVKERNVASDNLVNYIAKK